MSTARGLGTLGLIVNRLAGSGVGRSTVEMALKALGATRVITGPGDMGAALIDPTHWAVEVIAVPDHGGAAQTMALSRGMADREVAVIVAIGGDGTLADVAAGIVGRPDAPAVCGIGSGSVSAGQLVTCTIADLGQLDRRRLEPRPTPALVATHRGKSAFAFNDVILGTTLVGTFEGRLRDLDAVAYLEGQRRPGRPRTIGQAGTVVTRTGGPGELDAEAAGMVITRGRLVGGVVVGFTSPAYVGKAVTGGVCLGSWVGWPAGCVVSDVPLARAELSSASVAVMRPVRSAYASLDVGYRLVIEGVRSNTVLLADGNPLAVLQQRDRVEVTVRPEALRVLRPVWTLLQSRAIEGPRSGDKA